MNRRGRMRVSRRPVIGRGRRRISGLLAAVLAIGGLSIGMTAADPEAAVAAPAGCGYADTSANNGRYASTICWFDFSQFDQVQARSSQGQPIEVTLDGGLVARFTARLTDIPDYVPMTLERRSTPLETRFAFGTDAYRGVPGLHSLYSNPAPAGDKGGRISFEDIEVVDAAGRPVAGYSFVAADTEDNISVESFSWHSDKPLREIERLAPNGRWGCKNPVGLGTTSVTCAGTGQGATSIAGGKSTALLVAADSPSSFATEWFTPARSGIAIGIQTAKLTVVKDVASRVAPTDSFQVTASNASGVVVAQDTTGEADVASTGPLIVAPGASYTVGEVAEAGTSTNLAHYTSLWSCTNTATGSATVLPSGPGLSQTIVPSAGDDITCTVTNTARPSSIALEKMAAPAVDVNGNGITDAGDTIGYSFTVTNTGQTDLDTVAVDDPKAGSVTCPAVVLAPTESTTCTADAPYVITPADVTAGAADNTATATAHPLGSPAVTSAVATTSTPVVAPAPALTLVKSASPSNADAYTAGQQIVYSFVVRNTGNVPVENVVIEDSGFSGTGTLSPISCPADFGTLAVNAQATCTASYTLTQEDVDAGGVRNAAVATGDPVGGPGPVDSPTSEVSIPADASSSVSLTKRATPATAHAPGDVITYEFDVTNTGNVSLGGASVTETAFTGTGAAPTPSCPTGTFLPGETVTCTASYMLTQADVNAGSVSNTATASAAAPSGADPVSAPSSATVTIAADPSLTLAKTASVAGAGVAGEAVTYTFEVTNSGNVTIAGIAIDEISFSGTGSLPTAVCEQTTLDAGESTTCTATYTLTQADVNAGAVTNMATATGVPAGTSTRIASVPDDALVETSSVARIALQKSADGAGVSVAGDDITYSFVVTNTGTVDLANPTVTETAFSGSGTAPSVSCPATLLAPGAAATCTATYTVTQDDVDSGTITNSATATATPPAGLDAPVSEPSSAAVAIVAAPGLSVVKSASSASPGGYVAGQVITYSFVVTNTGNVTLAGVEVEEREFTGTDALAPPVCADGATALAPGAQVVCRTHYTLTQADVDAGSVSNSATATADPPGTTPPPQAPVDEVTIPEIAAPALSLVKATDTTAITAPGQVVDYTFTVTNTGNTTLTDVTVLEDSFSGVGDISTPVCPQAAGTLLPGQSVVCAASYSVQHGDLAGDPLVNTAIARAQAPDDAAVESDPSTARVTEVTRLSTGAIAATGAEAPLASIAAAVTLLVGGGVLLLIRRRRLSAG